MNDPWVGVLAFPDLNGCVLKQGALLFDQLAITYSDVSDDAVLIEWLLDREVLATAWSHGALVDGVSYRFDSDATRKEMDSDDTNVRYGRTYDEMCNSWARSHASLFSDLWPDRTVLPVLTAPPGADGENRSAIVRVVLKELPLPSDDTPWEAVLDWRQDEEARIRYRRLRAWVNRMCRSDVSARDVADELATLIDDYQTYAKKRHRLLNLGRAEVLATTGAYALQDLAHLNLGDAVSRLFVLLRGEASLSESELEAPGREVAYIVEARRRLDQ